MSIYIGSSKIGKIYVGSTAIGKVYKGSELVWESGLKLYAYKLTSGDITALYVNVGGIGTNYPVAILWFQNNASPRVTYNKFTAISGTLGASNSKITIDGNQHTYKKSVTVNGITIYIYTYEVPSQFFTTYNWAWVLKGTTVNQSKVLLSVESTDATSIPYPYSANSSQLKITSDATAAPRYSAADTTWK